MSSAGNLCKQIGPRSGPTFCRARSGSKVFDTQMVFLKEFFVKVNFEKKSADDKMHEKLSSRLRVKWLMNFKVTVLDFLFTLNYDGGRRLEGTGV